MLFDLRSRGRRRTVQAVYLGLALLMGGGLVLFGVGAGNGFGGILDAFTNNGSGGSQKAVVSQDEKNALAAINLNPNSPANWVALVKARDATAKQEYNPNTGQFTAAGVKELASEGQAWQQYLKLTTKPDPDVAVLAARAYDSLGSFKDEASAWEIVTAANPTTATFFENLANAAYLAKQTHKGDLAAAKAVSLVPKAQQFEVKQQLNQLKARAATSTAGASSGATATSTTGR
jgi:hypothetical protein